LSAEVAELVVLFHLKAADV